MLTTSQAQQVISFLGEAVIQAMQSMAVQSKMYGVNIDHEYAEGKNNMEVFIHNALHTNKVQPDFKDILPPDDGEAANDPSPVIPQPPVTA